MNRGRAEPGPFDRVLFGPVWLGFGGCTILFALGVSVPEWVQYIPFLASVLILGLPHGAVDHLVVARAPGSNVNRPLAVVGIVYLLGGGVYFLLWLLAPAAAFVVFIALTWFHWGQGDLYSLTVGNTHLRTRGQRALAVVVRGGLPMIVPLLAFPGVYRSVARAVTVPFDPNAMAALGWAFTSGARLALGTGLFVCSALAITCGYRRATSAENRHAWALDAGETCLLWAYFLVVPPVLAVGLYFCLWHSLRHIVRVITLDDATVASTVPIEANRSIGAAFSRFARESAPLTAGALVVFVGIYLLAPVETVLRAIGRYLVLLAVLTLPHVLVVSWLDRRQGIW